MYDKKQYEEIVKIYEIEELKPDSDPVVVTVNKSRAMWVSYDPIARSSKGHTSGYKHALINWRILPTDPAGIAFDIYKSEDGSTEVKLNTVNTCF